MSNQYLEHIRKVRASNPAMIFLLVTVLFQFAFASQSSAAESGSFRIGTNVEGIHDYSGDWPFINRMKSARKWITFDITEVDKTWDTRVEIPLDKNGYPIIIPYDPDGDGPVAPQAVRTILYNRFDTYPAGTYKVRFEGTGKLRKPDLSLDPVSRCNDFRIIRR